MARLSTNERMSLAHSLRKPVSLAGNPAAAPFAWTDAALGRLRDLLADGATASDAARLLGCSRNAVIGKAHREGIVFGRTGIGGKGHSKSDYDKDIAYQARLARERQARADAAQARRDHSAARRLADAAPAVHIAPTRPVAAPARGPMTLLDERFRQGWHCRWPVGEADGHRGRHLFCAADVPVFGETYCACHAIEACASAATMAARSAAAAKFTEEAQRRGRRVSALFGR